MFPDLSIKPISFSTEANHVLKYTYLEIISFRVSNISITWVPFFSVSNNSYRPSVLVTINLIALGLKIILCKRRVLGPRARGALTVWFQD